MLKNRQTSAADLQFYMCTPGMTAERQEQKSKTTAVLSANESGATLNCQTV